MSQSSLLLTDDSDAGVSFREYPELFFFASVGLLAALSQA